MNIYFLKVFRFETHKMHVSKYVSSQTFEKQKLRKFKITKLSKNRL